MRNTICRVLVVVVAILALNISFGYAQVGLEKVDINKATLQDLIEVKGIAKVKAEAILDFVKEKGGIEDMEELLEVKGVGPKLLDVLKQRFEVKK